MRRLALLCVLSLSSFAAAEDATLQHVAGRVLLRARGEKTFEEAASGAALLFGDQVKTLKGASAHVVFITGDAVLVKENSVFSISGEATDVSISFKVGEFLIGLRRKLSSGESFRVRTPAAVAAVRGTLFWGKTDEKKNSVYASFANEIAITAQGRTVVLSPGQKLAIRMGKPPEKPAPAGIPLSYLDTFSVEGSLEGLSELVAPELRQAAPKPQQPEKSLHDLTR